MKAKKLLSKRIQINADSLKVWQTLTNPKLIKEWLGKKVISSWKIGATMHFKSANSSDVLLEKGTILQLETGKLLQCNYWSSLSGTPDVAENYSVITIILVVKNNSTVLSLTKSNFQSESAYQHSSKNWDMALSLIKEITER